MIPRRNLCYRPSIPANRPASSTSSGRARSTPEISKRRRSSSSATARELSTPCATATPIISGCSTSMVRPESNSPTSSRSLSATSTTPSTANNSPSSAATGNPTSSLSAPRKNNVERTSSKVGSSSYFDLADQPHRNRLTPCRWGAGYNCTHQMPLTSGTRLGPYEIQCPIGAGGMGEVYRARDTRLDRRVAVKVLPSHLCDQAEARERFDREARAISSLNHSHICQLYDVGSQDGVSYLVMELLEGESLGDRLRRGTLPLDQVLRYGAEIAAGLQAAHRCGVVHRDLKPGNVMLTKAGAKLMDFGLAKGTIAPNKQMSDLTATLTSHNATPLTAHGTIVGTFQYMSPEQVEGKEADARSDIFSLGALLYEMITGKRAFTGKSQANIVASILASEPPPISIVQPMTPPALVQVVKTCLAKDPEERFQTVHDLKLQLKWIADASSSQLAAPAQVRARRVVQKRTLLIAAVLGWILAAAALAIFLSSRAQLEEAQRPMTASWLPPNGTEFAIASAGALALSPDGSKLAFLT